MRYVAIVVFILIILSLAAGLYFVMHDEPGSKRAVKALAIRVGLSIALFLVLMGSVYFGVMPGRVP